MRDTLFRIMGNKVAIFLAGCGHADGAEITEAVLTNLALRSNGLETEFYSIDKAQLQVGNHFNHMPSDEQRNTLHESARIARGKIKDISEFQLSKYAALAFPGGFGVAKNFCDFAVKAQKATIDGQLEHFLIEALNTKKPIMAVCIAPALIGLAAHKAGLKIKITLGTNSNDASKAMQALGHTVETRQPTEYLADEEHFIVSTPAYMHDTQPELLWKGISLAATHLVSWLKSK